MNVTDDMVRKAAQAAYGIHFERYQGMMRKALEAALVPDPEPSKLPPSCDCPSCQNKVRLS